MGLPDGLQFVLGLTDSRLICVLAAMRAPLPYDPTTLTDDELRKAWESMSGDAEPDLERAIIEEMERRELDL